jgi:hypothetical protein
MCFRNGLHIKSVLSEIQTMYDEADPPTTFLISLGSTITLKSSEKEGADMEVLLLQLFCTMQEMDQNFPIGWNHSAQELSMTS